MKLSRKEWNNYVNKLSAINKTAGRKMQEWIDRFGTNDVSSLVTMAYALTTKYGEASSATACQMYDEVARRQKANVPPAEPKPTQNVKYVDKAIRSTLERAPGEVPNTVSEMVKRTGAETTLKNAKRDGAYFAWVPTGGETCAFCITLASNGWCRASKKTINGDHAEHIHKNCDCEFAISFGGPGQIEGYDPDMYRAIYDNAEGDTWQDKVNSMRRTHYAANKDYINAQKRAAYARRMTNKRELSIKAAQSPGDCVKPSGLDFEDYKQLDLTIDEKNKISTLRDLADETNWEHGLSCCDGTWTKPHTDKSPFEVKIPFLAKADSVDLYHSHTDDSPPSDVDMKSLLRPSIRRIGVSTANGDMWVIDIGHGIRPTEKEMDDALKLCYNQAQRNVSLHPKFYDWTYEERMYMLIRERMRLVANYFEWDVKGGRL